MFLWWLSPPGGDVVLETAGQYVTKMHKVVIKNLGMLFIFLTLISMGLHLPSQTCSRCNSIRVLTCSAGL